MKNSCLVDLQFPATREQLQGVCFERFLTCYSNSFRTNFGQIVGQDFDRIFGQGFDQGFGEGKNQHFRDQQF